jgi:hypothetical protein
MKYKSAQCCNFDCGWSGEISDTLRRKHDTGDRFCPLCHEVVEIEEVDTEEATDD